MVKDMEEIGCRQSRRTAPDLYGKDVTVMGMGKSGLAATHVLQMLGARVTLADEREECASQQAHASLSSQNIRIGVGKNFPEACQSAEWMIVSPGFPPTHPQLEMARTRGVRIVGEAEFASWFFSCPLIAVTGTNGKSTTVTLISQILKAAEKSIFAGGNLGNPLSLAVPPFVSVAGRHQDSASPFDFIIAEISSFQLETIERFHPWLAVLLNLSSDHLNRHPSFSQYCETKKKIFSNQTPEDQALVNMDDPCVARIADTLSIPLVGLGSTGRHAQESVYLNGTTIKARIAGKEWTVMDRDHIRLRGNHNLTNVFAAIAVAMLCRCPLDIIRTVIKTFPGLEHALEFVRDFHGILFYNDSKGTNIDATVKALESFQEKIVLIAGGTLKGSDVAPLRDPIRQKVKHAILIGASTPQFLETLNGVTTLTTASSLAEAVKVGADIASPGDVVLLSPACASFDMFKDYADRGRQFKELVHALPAQK